MREKKNDQVDGGTGCLLHFLRTNRLARFYMERAPDNIFNTWTERGIICLPFLAYYIYLSQLVD